MKFTGTIIGLLFASLFAVSAQLAVEITLEQDQYLPAESLVAAVHISNSSGQTLHFGKDSDWLTFSIESGEGSIVVKNGEPPVLGEFTLESAKVATRRVELAPYFSLPRSGRYKIIATVRVKEWNNQVTSAPKPFDLIQGTKLWTQEFGVPNTTDTNSVPEIRRYTLQQANYLRTQPLLYFTLRDAVESKVMKVFSIGSLVSFSHPDPQLDKWSNLHLLYQNGARTFSYTVITPDGDLVVRQTYETADSRPKLQMDQEGKYVVAGGIRRISANDLPVTKSTENDVKLPKQ